MTTACCEYYGLPDDCVELTTMRQLRDRYLMNTEKGQQQVAEYYRIAPNIVEEINRSSNPQQHYKYIYSMIQHCVDMVQKNRYEEAVNEYYKMINQLDLTFAK